MSYGTYQSVGYGYGCRTKLTEGLGTGMNVLPSLPKGRVWYGCLYPYPYLIWGILTGPYPVPGYFPAGVLNFPECRVRVLMSYRTYQSVGYGYGCRTELTKVSGTVMDIVPTSLPKGRVRVWMFCQAYRKLGYGTAACTRTRTRPRVFQHGRTRYQTIFQRSYRTYQSVGYGYSCRTELTKVSGTGTDVVRNLPKCRVRVWMSYQTYQRVG